MRRFSFAKLWENCMSLRVGRCQELCKTSNPRRQPHWFVGLTPGCSRRNDLALPYANNSQLKMIHITSFNEWHEDTEIEPSVVTGSTTTDTSSTGSQYTQGLVYQGFGTTYLDILRNEIAVLKPH